MKIEIELANERIADLLAEANFAYWGRFAEGTRLANIRAMLVGTDTILIFEHAGEAEPGSKEEKKHHVGINSIRQAVQRATKKLPHLLEQLFDDTKSDMYTGDLLLQLACFGEEKYA